MSTAAERILNEAGVEFEALTYRYEEGMGADGAAVALSLDPHQVVKTLVMTDGDKPLCVLMHGDETVSTKALARAIATKTVRPAEPRMAEKWSGYRVGGTSPIGMKTAMPVYVESTILDYEHIYLNGGKRGFLVGVATADLSAVLNLIPVEVKA